MSKILRNKDLSTYRTKQLVLQNYIDPLTKLKIVKPVLDHQHGGLGVVRKCLNFDSNQLEGKITSAYNRFLKHTGVPLKDILLNLIMYLENDYSSNPIHPKEISLKIKRFSRLTSRKQYETLKIECNTVFFNKSTKKQNLKAYKDYLMKPENIYKV